MRGLKILVIVMGVMLVAGFVGLITLIAVRLSRGGAAATPARPFAADPIEIPRGARIESMSVGGDRLVLEVALPEGGRQLVVIDLSTGTRLGAIELRAGP
jgi:Family of unknown function (DUF6476)